MQFVSYAMGRSVVLRAVLPLFVLTSFSAALAQTPTDIQITSVVQQSSVKRLGVNLADQTFYDSGQMLKNLIFQNPGFEAMKYRSIMICNAVTGNTCTDDNNYSPQPTGFWTGGTYKILSGSASGATGTIVSSTKNPSGCSGCGQIIQFDQNLNTKVGDYFVLSNAFSGSGDAGWWDSTSGGGTITTETTDLSPETPGKQALLLSASASGQSASVAQYFDNDDGLSFIQMNGNFALTFRAKGVGGSNKLSVNVERANSAGNRVYINQTVTLTNAWQDYTLTFSASENGSASGTAQAVFSAGGSSVELDDVSLAQTDSSPTNTSPFRDDVVNALKELNPGTLRMMAGDAALGSDLPNQLQVPFARYRMGWSTGATSTNVVSYGIHEFLQLCEIVGADPWITIPTATTPEEMTDFIEYLTGNGSDQWSALRIARGQSAPWTTVFNKIHLELGNETWNGSFRGESMNYNAYPGLANQVFGAARQAPGYKASSFDLILDGFAASPGYNSVLLATSNQHDSIDIAPYLLFSANNEPQSTLFGALYAEPEMFNSTGGEVYKDMLAVQAAPTPTYMSVYETNLSPIEGSITEAQLNQLTPSVGAGLAHTEHMLQMMRLGVRYQNAFALPQYEFQRSDGNLVKLWGIVFDMGTTNRRRPQFLTQSLANSAIGGNMLQTTQTGANPTWNQPLSSDNVQLNGAHYLQSFAFQNGSSVSVVIFNLNQTTALQVTFSGPNVPSGSVQMSQITSGNITDNNESSSVVQATTQTLSGFNPATGLSLPPYSMTVLATAGNTVQAPVFSVPAGTYASAQTVTITDGSNGAAIYYTTDGSTPTASSTLYTGPVTISSSETLQAMATATGLNPSAVTSAAYVIGYPTVATPIFSVDAGTYSSAQTVSISDATSGATIYYTTDGTTPTTSSAKYAGAITVSSSETINAIAAAANYNNSAEATATYTISGTTATPVFSVAAGTYTAAQSVSISDATSGATIYYTTDDTTPTTSSAKYAGPVTVSSSETIKAIAAATNYGNSAVATAIYTINVPAATPVFSVAAGTYTAAQSVSISDATSGATIYYTTDGTTPTTSSAKYAGPVTVSSSETIEAIAAATSYSSSAVATATYTINVPTATPVFSVAAGTYTAAQSVSISDTTSGSTIHYTTDGTTPTVSSAKYTAPLTVNSTETIKAMATANGGKSQSLVATATYTIEITAAKPTFSVAPGTYTSAKNVSLKDTTAGVTIYYTTNGATPTTSSAMYSQAINVASNMTIKAIAAGSTVNVSAVATAAYIIKLKTASPTFSMAAGTYTSTQAVILKDATAGAAIYYTTDGTTPTTSSAEYTAAIAVNKSETIKAIAITSGGTASAVGTATYTIELPAAAPTFSIAQGTYTSAQTVTLADTTAGAAIYYTINGGTPTVASTKYTAAITVKQTEVIRAIAVGAGASTSKMATATYYITLPPAAPTFSVPQGTYASAQTIALTDATAGAMIYYTINGGAPTAASTRYTAPLAVKQTAVIRAIAVASGTATSAMAAATYTIASAAARPTFSVAQGTYTSAQTVMLADATAGAAIYYTINGGTPTAASTKYTAPIVVKQTEVIRAVAVVPGGPASPMATATYYITLATATPAFSVVQGTYAGAQTVTLTDATAGAAIYYTINGGTPTAASTKYTAPIVVKQTEVIRAIAAVPDGPASPMATATYYITLATATPAFSVVQGTYAGAQTVTLTDATAGAAIYYTINGATPTTASNRYTGPIDVKQTEVIRAIAVVPGAVVSKLATATYLIK